MKRFVVEMLDRIGFNRLSLQMHGKGLLVLGYHSILLKQQPQPFRYHHTADEFSLHLDWLNRFCTPVGLDGVRKWFSGNWTHSKPPALVTFDDGYRNNAAVAAELLLRKGVPAVFFLSTDYIGRDAVLWPDELFARVMAWEPSVSLRLPDGSTVSASSHDRTRLAFRILQACKDSPQQDRLDYLEYLRSQTPAANVKLAPQVQDFMSWDDARTLAAAGFHLGSHTVTHPILSRIDSTQLRSEMAESRIRIEQETGCRCEAIAYPNGGPKDYSREVLEAAAEAGYEFGFIVSGRWRDRPDNPLAIDRIVPPGHTTAATFALYASGARNWIPLS